MASSDNKPQPSQPTPRPPQTGSGHTTPDKPNDRQPFPKYINFEKAMLLEKMDEASGGNIWIRYRSFAEEVLLFKSDSSGPHNVSLKEINQEFPLNKSVALPTKASSVSVLVDARDADPPDERQDPYKTGAKYEELGCLSLVLKAGDRWDTRPHELTKDKVKFKLWYSYSDVPLEKIDLLDGHPDDPKPQTETQLPKDLDLTGTWTGDDKGVYHFRYSTTNGICFIGQDPGGRWVRVFRGIRLGTTDKIEGSWVDVPQAPSVGAGKLTLRIVSPERLEVVSDEKLPFDDKFDASLPVSGYKPKYVFKKTSSEIQNPPFNTAPARYTGKLTGGYRADDGRYYYVRQVGKQVWWLGGDADGTGRHVFLGDFDGISISGTWIGIQKSDGLGSLVVHPEPPPGKGVAMSLVKSSGSFKASVWRRADAKALLQVSFEKLTCTETTGEGSYDEPYALIFVADLTPAILSAYRHDRKLPYAASKCFMTDLFEDIHTGVFTDGKTEGVQHLAVWGLSQDNAGKSLPAPLPFPEDAAILVALMEHDTSDLATVKTEVEAVLITYLVNYMIPNDSYASIVNNLKEKMEVATDISKLISGGLPNADNRIGHVQHLSLTGDDIKKALARTRVTKKLSFAGEGAKYSLEFSVAGALGV